MGRAESGEELGFAQELVYGEAAFGLPDLDRNEALHVRVRREEHLRLRSAPKAPLDPISLVQGFADHSLIALFQRTVAVSINKW
jgi:hypothetical protein